MGSEDQRVLLASDAGYGFVGKLGDLVSKNKAGKAALTLPKGAEVLPPTVIEDLDNTWLAAFSNEGRLLVFKVTELPELARGKGNKIINIPSARVQSREEFVIALAVVQASDTLKVVSGKRHLNLKFKDLEHYIGERGRRGNKLPRGFQKVDAVELL